MRLPRILPFVLVAMLLTPSTAHARVPLKPQQIVREHRIMSLRAQVLVWRHKAVVLSTQVGPTQDTSGPITSRSIPFLIWLREDWHKRADQFASLAEQVPAPIPSTPAPAASGSVYANLLCIHPFEEPSWSTVAGGLGFVSPPSSYNVGSTDALAAQYGDSWASWPESAQLEFGAQLVAAYGYSPWSTAFRCGL